MNKLKNITIKSVIIILMTTGLIFTYNSICFILSIFGIIDVSKIPHVREDIFSMILFWGSFVGLLIEGILFLKVFSFKYHKLFGYVFLIVWILTLISLAYYLNRTYSTG